MGAGCPKKPQGCPSYSLPAPSSILEAKESDESDDQELENASTGKDSGVGEPGDEELDSDVEEFSWDGLLIEDEDEDMYCSA